MNIVEKEQNIVLDNDIVKLLNENKDIFKNFINELKDKNTPKRIQPKTKWELRDIIINRICNEGFKCNLNDIDVSKIEDMSSLFNSRPSLGGNEIFKDFNGDISHWDVSNVTDMRYMFYGCENFNGNLSCWNVSRVIYMEYMFGYCVKFNSNISAWIVSNVEYMNGMFWDCEKFNCDISRWDVSNVKNISDMFFMCEQFNQNLDKWDVSNIDKTDMYCAFNRCPTRPKWY